MGDDNYEWWEDENGRWYYRDKSTPDGEWQLWEDDQSQTSHNDSPDLNTDSKETTQNPIIYCENMDWDDMLLNIKYLKKDSKLLTITLNKEVSKILEVASGDHLLTRKNRIQIYPDIKRKNVEKVLQKNKYKSNGRISYDDIWMIIDESTFKNGNSGILVTSQGLYIRSLGRKAFLPWMIEDKWVSSFYEEKGFLSRKLFATLSDNTKLEVFDTVEETLNKSIQEVTGYLTLIADLARKEYCNENGLKYTFVYEKAKKFTANIGNGIKDLAVNSVSKGMGMLQGDCPSCGGVMRDASMAARGGKALLRGFAKLDRSMVSKSTNPNLRSAFGRSGGWFDSKISDKSRVCDSCGYKE
ncbi:hypothetical protein N9L15_00705 [Euryarchaeota archaeon]|nr:hypothetical protein [Euryarchaeota archaeon]